MISNEVHIYAGDNNSHVGEEIEAHQSSQEISKLPERVGDDKNPLEPPQMPFLDSDRPTCKQRGKVFLKMLEHTHHIKRPIRTKKLTHCIHVETERQSLHNRLQHHFKRTFHLVKSCTVIPRLSRKSRSTPKPHTDHNPILLHIAMPTADDSHAAAAQQEYIQRPPRIHYHSARLKYNNVLQKFKTITEGKLEEGAERLKILKFDLTQGKFDADKYSDSANTILVSIIQQAAQTTLGHIDPRDRLARDDGPDIQPDSEEASKATKYSSNDLEIKNAQSGLHARNDLQMAKESSAFPNTIKGHVDEVRDANNHMKRTKHLQRQQFTATEVTGQVQ